MNDSDIEDYSNDNDLGSDYEEQTEPTLTYKVQNGRIQSKVTGYNAMVQAVDKILKTERFVYPIYDENYGNDFTDLIAKNPDYIQSESERMIKEALLADDRVTNVNILDTTFNNNKFILKARVETIFGSIPINQEVIE